MNTSYPSVHPDHNEMPVTPQFIHAKPKPNHHVHILFWMCTDLDVDILYCSIGVTHGKMLQTDRPVSQIDR